MLAETRVPIGSSVDIVTARQKGRAMAMDLGFEGSDLTLIATAISEIARNIVDHAQRGEIILSTFVEGKDQGIAIVAEDHGPGIKDLAMAMQYGYSTRNGLGVGLPGAKWLMDEFAIESEAGQGTRISMRKCLRGA